tara:strand:+ start:12739 stop:13011 length:273 start_codon:yes stop_codon:yes gene_type:complete
MKITFMISALGKIHLLQHDTKNVERPRHAKTSEVNNEREWERFKNYRPDLIDRFTRNKFEPPKLVGVIDGAVEWYEGVDVESWMKEELDI